MRSMSPSHAAVENPPQCGWPRPAASRGRPDTPACSSTGATRADKPRPHARTDRLPSRSAAASGRDRYRPSRAGGIGIPAGTGATRPSPRRARAPSGFSGRPTQSPTHGFSVLSIERTGVHSPEKSTCARAGAAHSVTPATRSPRFVRCRRHRCMTLLRSAKFRFCLRIRYTSRAPRLSSSGTPLRAQWALEKSALVRDSAIGAAGGGTDPVALGRAEPGFGRLASGTTTGSSCARMSAR